jgi:aminoglycoside 6'-N-acetyltransferase
VSDLLSGDRLTLRPMTEHDLGAVAAMLAEPSVRGWWGDQDPDKIRSELLEDAEVETFAIDVEGTLAGVVLVAEENTPEYRHAGLDISLATEFQGRGLGREALRLVIDHLAGERGHHRFTIDPDAGNERAIRCYTAVGFRPVGIMRGYSNVDGRGWRDGLLMDLLAEDL